jgi:hypothetical protein
MLAVYSIAILVLAMCVLEPLNALVPSLGLERRPGRLLRPGLRHLVAAIGLLAAVFAADLPRFRSEPDWGRTVLPLGVDLGFVSTAFGLRMMRRQSLLAWVGWCFILAVVFTLVYALAWLFLVEFSRIS